MAKWRSPEVSHQDAILPPWNLYKLHFIDLYHIKPLRFFMFIFAGKVTSWDLLFLLRLKLETKNACGGFLYESSLGYPPKIAFSDWFRSNLDLHRCLQTFATIQLAHRMIIRWIILYSGLLNYHRRQSDAFTWPSICKEEVRCSSFFHVLLAALCFLCFWPCKKAGDRRNPPFSPSFWTCFRS